ncbi:MAG: DUF2207 domain-containing protein [Bacillota bacterium]
MKKILLLIFALALVLPVVFTPSTAEAAGGLTITDYNTKIVLRENNVYDVTEVITVRYVTPHHGIERLIPVLYKWDTPEGQKEYNAFISNVQVTGDQYEAYTKEGIYYLRIGDPDRTITGERAYTIKYSLDVGDDRFSAYDFFYYNVIGTEWNAPIEKASFTINMPKAFDTSKLQVYTGRYGSTGSNATVQVNGNTITGETAQALYPYEGVTVYIQLPEGYFTGERAMAPLELPILIVMGVLVLLGLILFIAFGRDKQAVQTVEFDAPDGMTSAEVGYIIDGCVDNRDAVSLIIYWADKGYLEIEERGKNDFVLRKLGDIPLNAKEFERTFFFGLFEGRDEVAIGDLKYSFYETMGRVKAEIAASFDNRERRVFTKRSLRLQAWMSFFTALPFALSLLYANYLETYRIGEAAILSGLALIIVLPPVYILGHLMRGWRGQTRGKRMVKLIGSLVFLGLAMAGYILLMTLAYDKALLGCAGALATLVLAMLSVFMRKRTDNGLRWFGQVLGLRQFIATAEKDRIEMLVRENPQYFYKILPFAYVLGVSETWARNFEKIGIQPEPPGWYRGYNMSLFTTMWLMHSLNHSLYSMGAAMNARPAPSGGSAGFGGGGFGGGGGFSGGGFGGGGGGGW